MKRNEEPAPAQGSEKSLAKASKEAAGLKALTVTFEHARSQTGLLRGLRVLSRANQESGFDCPGCAWPDPEHRSPAEFCENGAKAILDEATKKRVGRDFFARYSVQQLKSKSERWLNAQGRITEPFVLREDASHYEPLSYDEAFHIIAETLQSLKDPNEASFYTSGRASNEAAFLYQLMVRAFGTNNLPDCSNLCHESSGVALKETLGIAKGTVRLDDFGRADLIFVIGQNPGTNHPRMLSALREAKLKGAAVISVNPLVEAGLVRFSHPQDLGDLLDGGVKISDHFVRLKVNGDQALFRGINKALLEQEHCTPRAVDRSFISSYTHGIASFEEVVRKNPWTQIEKDSGIAKSSIQALANRVAKAKGVICCWAMGLTQHQNAVVTIQEVTNFLLLTGNMGRPGAGACPVRGHSNVQGDRSMGIAATLPAPFAQKLKKELNVPIPQEPGLDTIGTIQGMAAGKVRAFVSLGGNFLSASPDTAFTEKALKACELTVQISTKLNRSHLITGRSALILPCLARSERDLVEGLPQFVSVENSMGVVHSSQGTLPPAHEGLLGEATIVAKIAERLLRQAAKQNEEANATETDSSPIPWTLLARDYDKIRDLIERVVPGFEDYNRRVRIPGGFELANGPRSRNFTTPSGRALFIPATLNRVEAREGELLLMTVRSHDQFNTTIYSNNDRYRGIKNTRKVILLSPEDLQALGIKSGQKLRITSHHTGPDGATQTRVLEGMEAISYQTPQGTAVAYFPEANPLVFLESYADRSRTPTSKSVRITLEAI